MRLNQRTIMPLATKNRNLGNIVLRSSDVTGTATLAPGDTLTATITVSTPKNDRLICVPDITAYQTSVTDDNKILGGSNVTSSDYQVIGPWNDWGETDGNNTVTKLYMKNISNRNQNISKVIGQSSDDGNIGSDSNWNYTNTNLLTGRSATPNDLTTGVRFTNITIPNSATINSAILSFIGQTSKSANVDTLIYGIDEDNTATFTSDPTGRTKTTASVAWNLTSETIDVASITPDISTIIQEIVNRVGWASGNALGFLILNNGSLDNNFLSWYSYDNTFSFPFLTINYTPIGTSQDVIIKTASRAIVNNPDVSTI